MLLSAAKQEAFEENLRLKNQFRTLDDDEIDFLDSVLESTRAKEQLVKRETAEQLDAYRKQREAAEKVSSEAESVAENTKGATSTSTEELWTTTSRKRRHVKAWESGRVSKISRKSSMTAKASQNKSPADEQTPDEATCSQGDGKPISSDSDRASTKVEPSKPHGVKSSKTSVVTPQSTPTMLGLGVYDSDEE